VLHPICGICFQRFRDNQQLRAVQIDAQVLPRKKWSSGKPSVSRAARFRPVATS
jgi:hypothetical protein